MGFDDFVNWISYLVIATAGTQNFAIPESEWFSGVCDGMRRAPMPHVLSWPSEK